MARIYKNRNSRLQHTSSLEHLVQVELETIASDRASHNSANSQISSIDLGQDVSRSPTLAEEQRSWLQLNEHKEEPQQLSDPRRSGFSSETWMKAVNVNQSIDQIRHPVKTAGIAFSNLGVFGYKSSSYVQPTVGNFFLKFFNYQRFLCYKRNSARVQILRGFDGLIRSGEMLLVLGRPGSGCTTFLKTLAGEMDGICVNEISFLNYEGIPSSQMHQQFRGEAIYTAETDIHFPQLTVGETLKFAARARMPRNTLPCLEGQTQPYPEHMRDVVMAMLGLSHTIDTRVGNDYIRGVSGGERKRVSIAEAVLNQSPIQCWDNSTRGLDSATALEFCRTLQLCAKYLKRTVCVTLYQSSQNSYEMFDKVTLLYEGRQVYFGSVDRAKEYFTSMGFVCPERQTTADFLTSLTNPSERIVKPGYEHVIPRTPDEFVSAWRNSCDYNNLLTEIYAYNKNFPIGGESVDKFVSARRAEKSRLQRVRSPFTVSFYEQIKLCFGRGLLRLRRDLSLMVTQLIGNLLLATVIGSVFYNLPDDTSSFNKKGALLFFAILLNAFSSLLEILTLYAQRPIVEKHARYALYHPSAEAAASVLCELPQKIFNAITFNTILYWMSNLRREADGYLIFLLFSFTTTLTMSMIFRSLAASTRTLDQALTPAALVILALVIYTGFIIPVRNMLSWSRWINYVNPIAYAFESLMINEFSSRDFACAPSMFIPSGGPYDSVPLQNKICAVLGARAGETSISGNRYLEKSFSYSETHLWRNLGIMLGYSVFFMCVYLILSEYVAEAKSKGEVLLFRNRSRRYPATQLKNINNNSSRTIAPLTHEEAGEYSSNMAFKANIQPHTSVLHWQNVCYDLTKGDCRRILDHVDGWIKPGTCTALMGVSGAGKTTLLDVLAGRANIGIVSGQILTDGVARDTAFPRKIGYVQQQDLHLPTSTVREALQFSALLRQPASVSRKDKLAYVEEVIRLLDMETYAEAIIGLPGEGLNVEQRKRLTIAVELAARPKLLLFLDEPTSGLDSQTAWSILDLLDLLTQHGQAVLCTIHQPSAMLFQRFDRLLLLAKGGKTVYFGDIGQNSRTLANYFERHGGRPLLPGKNPAEWMLEVIGAAPGSHTEIDWVAVWRNSPDNHAVQRHLEYLKSSSARSAAHSNDTKNLNEFAAPFWIQLVECLRRIFTQYWRSPIYVYSKLCLSVLSALFIGLSFLNAENSIQGLQNQMFSLFMLMTTVNNLIQQILPNFVLQRAMFEIRESPSKTYSWAVFMLANIIVEIPWNTLAAVLMYCSYYFPIGLYRNAEPTHAVLEREGLMFLLIWSAMIFASTFGHMIIAGIEAAETAGNLANILISLSLIFCGTLATPQSMPRFWIFMYRVSPFTYLVSALLSTAVSGTEVICETVELLRFDPPSHYTCQDYLGLYVHAVGGYVSNPDATTDCGLCTMSSTDTFLATVSIYWKDAWRNFGFMWAYIVFNVSTAVLIYWVVRVPKAKGWGRSQN